MIFPRYKPPVGEVLCDNLNSMNCDDPLTAIPSRGQKNEGKMLKFDKLSKTFLIHGVARSSKGILFS